MKKMLISVAASSRLRVVVTEKGILNNMEVECAQHAERRKGNIYLGEVKGVEPSLGAAFVYYGPERHGFLPFKNINPNALGISVPEGQEADIQSLIKTGQRLLVQVEKDERGTKGAALTTFIVLSGSYLILMPNNPRISGISKSIENEERDHLRSLLPQLDVPKNAGLIVRTAGARRSLEELKWELSMLCAQWKAINQAAQQSIPPALIYRESDLLRRALRDYLRHDVTEVLIDEPKVFERAKRYIQQIRPDFLSRLHFYQESTPLLVKYQIQHQIESAYAREVRLPSGGTIVIDSPEALVAIDVNSGRATRGSDIEETAFNTNMEAVREIARQVLLRDLSGIIVIDLIDMKRSANRQQVRKHLSDCLSHDPARIVLGYISQFGLLVLSRQRMHPSLGELNQENCPRCAGSGKIPSTELLTHNLLGMMEEKAVNHGCAKIYAYLPVDVATDLMNEKRLLLQAVEKRQGVSIAVIPTPQLESPQYKLYLSRKDDGKKSYLMLNEVSEAVTPKEDTDRLYSQPAEAAVQAIFTEARPPVKVSQLTCFYKWLKRLSLFATKLFGKRSGRSSHYNRKKRNPYYAKQQRSRSQDRGRRVSNTGSSGNKPSSHRDDRYRYNTNNRSQPVSANKDS